MNPAEAWKTCFSDWPKDVAHKGVVVTKFDEQVPFSEFLVSDTMVLLERSTPDTIGARKVFLPFDQIAGLKLVEVVKSSLFQPLGFRPGGKT